MKEFLLVGFLFIFIIVVVFGIMGLIDAAISKFKEWL